MPQGHFLVGAFDIAAQLWDRETTTVEAIPFFMDFFARNMIAILCEERLCLTVYQPNAFVYGAL